MSILPPIAITRKLARSGMDVSGMAWGCWRLTGRSGKEVRALFDAALSSGITLFDTADVYGLGESSYAGNGFGAAEALLGAAIADAPELREQIILATKGGITPPVPYNSSAAYIAGAIDNSLRRLRTETIDIWQIHRPDILTHPHEIAVAIDAAVAAGKIRSFGVSNFSTEQVSALNAYLSVPIASVQPELSCLCIDAVTGGVLDQAIALGMAVLAWSPLGGGRLFDPQMPTERAVAEALKQVAADQSVSVSAAAFSWIMAHPSRPIPIVGTQNPARLAEAANAYKVQWNRTDWYKVLVAARGEALP